jgi:hypothetical protein
VPAAAPDDDETRLFEPTPPRAPRPSPVPPPAPAAPLVAAPPPPAAAPPGRVGRFLRAAWEVTVTVAAMALFVGAWAMAVTGVLDGDSMRVYGGAAASVVFTPLAIHRLTGARGRYGAGLLGAGIATGAAVHYVGTAGDPAILLAAAFGLQVMVCFLLSVVTRRREPVTE